VHVDSAWAEEQLPGDLAVGAPDRDQPQHLDLTPRQAGVLKLARGASTESTLDPLAEASQLLGRGGRQGTGPEPTAGAVDGGQQFDRQAALPCRRERDGGSKLGLGPLVRHRKVAEEVKGVRELLGGCGGIPSASANSPHPGHA
jgi:hypothetical protein